MTDSIKDAFEAGYIDWLMVGVVFGFVLALWLFVVVVKGTRVQ